MFQMIFDTLKNAELYYGCHEGFKKGFDFIKKVIAEGTEVGKYEIDGVNFIDRGYENIEEVFSALGADIRRFQLD